MTCLLQLVVNKTCDWLKQIAWSASANSTVTTLCYYFVYYEVQVFVYYVEAPYCVATPSVATAPFLRFSCGSDQPLLTLSPNTSIKTKLFAQGNCGRIGVFSRRKRVLISEKRLMNPGNNRAVFIRPLIAGQLDLMNQLSNYFC